MRISSSIIMVLLSACLFWGAGRVGMHLRTQRPGAFEQPENAPPLLALTTVALGGFRGLIADMLWLRATRLQDEGRYVELVQLADWITRLDPGSPQIWGYHAWNMAFNVSLMMSAPGEAWRWIQHGIRLLRDDGLRYNPHDARLSFELGWIYMFKIGGTSDNRHHFFKQQLARDMTGLLETGTLKPEREPVTLAKRLRQEQGLDLALMKRIEERYGALDWRLPESHAIYWASHGMTSRGETALLDRIIYQCMGASYFSGTLAYNPGAGLYRRSPAIHLLPGTLNAYESAMKRGPGDTVRASYQRFLEAAISELERQGKIEETRPLAERLQQLSMGK